MGNSLPDEPNKIKILSMLIRVHPWDHRVLVGVNNYDYISAQTCAKTYPRRVLYLVWFLKPN